MFNLVGLEIGKTAHLEDAVLGHGGIPHEIAAGLHIVNIQKQAAHIDYRIPHNS